MKRAIFTNNSDVRLGFEIECIVANCYVENRYSGWVTNGKYERFQEKLRGLNGVSVGSDGSIRPKNSRSDRGCEIRTSPLPPKDAMKTLKAVFDLVNEYGYTNKTCGLHVNISSSNKSKMRKFNPLPFLSSHLWNEILRKFNRTSNHFCKPVIRCRNLRKTSRFNWFRRMYEATHEKFVCVNLRNFEAGNSATSRIEIRGFGNKNYTNKYDTISQFIKRIEKLFRFSCDDHPFVHVPKF